jgi:metal-responsive CopG/Arc/MetJ family transcriptional regulator
MATFSISLPDRIAHSVDMESNKLGFATRSEFIRTLLRRYFAGELRFEQFEKKPLESIRYQLAKTGKYSEKFIESVIKGLSKSSIYESRTTA